jgi:ribosomal protein S18 acetylase RimI-like enzyme
MLDIWDIEKRAFSPCDRSRKDFLERLMNNKKTILVYNKLGYAIGRELEWTERKLNHDNNYGKNNTLYLISIAVMPEKQNKNLGKKLLKQFIKKAKSKKFKRITLHTNNKRMIRLAFKFGFRTLRFEKIDGKKKSYMSKLII